jgi:hypothetical protein
MAVQLIASAVRGLIKTRYGTSLQACWRSRMSGMTDIHCKIVQPGGHNCVRADFARTSVPDVRA